MARARVRIRVGARVGGRLRLRLRLRGRGRVTGRIRGLRRSPVEPSSSLSTPSPPRAETSVLLQNASEMLSGVAAGTR